MSKHIKTRSSVKNIKVFEKSVSTSKRMKDAFVRTKDKAEETQNLRHTTPTDYANENIQYTARDSIYYLRNPRKKRLKTGDSPKGIFGRSNVKCRKHAIALL